MIAARIAIGRPSQAATIDCKSASTDDKERQAVPPGCSARAAQPSGRPAEVDLALSVTSKID